MALQVGSGPLVVVTDTCASIRGKRVAGGASARCVDSDRAFNFDRSASSPCHNLPMRLVAYALLPGFAFAQGSDYVRPAACSSCHREIHESYQRTGMGRSFYAPRTENTVEDYSRSNTYYHAASDERYTMYRSDGRYFQRRYQVGPDGKEKNVVEKEIHYVLGSGNHARTYLNRTSLGQLVQLPLGWYSEKGGIWAMNPGYDRPDHMEFRRKLDQECFFCHNAYPEKADGEDSGENCSFGARLRRGSIVSGVMARDVPTWRLQRAVHEEKP